MTFTISYYQQALKSKCITANAQRQRLKCKGLTTKAQRQTNDKRLKQQRPNGKVLKADLTAKKADLNLLN